MRFGNASTDWARDWADTGYYRLDGGVLMHAPVKTDGTRGNAEKEVDFTAIDSKAVQRAATIGEWLHANPGRSLIQPFDSCEWFQAFGRIVAEMNSRRIPAQLEGEGSSLVWIRIALEDGRIIAFGNSNDRWAADIYPSQKSFEDGQSPEEVETDLLSEVLDPVRVVNAYQHLRLRARLNPESPAEMSDEEIMASLEAELHRRGEQRITARVWNTGGGVHTLLVRCADGRVAVWGNNDKTWGADLCLSEGDFEANRYQEPSLQTSLPTSELAPQVVVDALLAALFPASPVERPGGRSLAERAARS